MNLKDRTAYIERQFNEMMAITKSKGVEYANSDLDANANFKTVGAMLGLDPKKVAMVYTLKHILSICSYVQKGEVKSNEPIEGRIHDAALYILLLGSLIDEEKNAH